MRSVHAPKQNRSESRRDESVSLKDAATFLLDECRMVLPGIQALFGFQLVAVFNQRFSDDLSRFDQRVHYIAIALVALAIAIIMTPAAMHRQMGVDKVTESFLVVSTRLLLASMAPLALGIALDFYLIGRLLLGEGLAAPLAATLVAVFALFWVILPRSAKLQRMIERP